MGATVCAAKTDGGQYMRNALDSIVLQMYFHPSLFTSVTPFTAEVLAFLMKRVDSSAGNIIYSRLCLLSLLARLRAERGTKTVKLPLPCVGDLWSRQYRRNALR